MNKETRNKVLDFVINAATRKMYDEVKNVMDHASGDTVGKYILYSIPKDAAKSFLENRRIPDFLGTVLEYMNTALLTGEYIICFDIDLHTDAYWVNKRKEIKSLIRDILLKDPDPKLDSYLEDFVNEVNG